MVFGGAGGRRGGGGGTLAIGGDEVCLKSPLGEALEPQDRGKGDREAEAGSYRRDVARRKTSGGKVGYCCATRRDGPLWWEEAHQSAS